MHQHQSLAIRVERALERNQELRAEYDRLRARYLAERERATRTSAEIDAWNEALRLQPWAQAGANWQAIELSEKYSSLRERAAILLVAEAFFAANENLRALAGRKLAGSRASGMERRQRQEEGEQGGVASRRRSSPLS